MATKAAQKRLTREYQALQKEPTPYISAHPCESNILESVSCVYRGFVAISP